MLQYTLLNSTRIAPSPTVHNFFLSPHISSLFLQYPPTLTSLGRLEENISLVERRFLEYNVCILHINTSVQWPQQRIAMYGKRIEE